MDKVIHQSNNSLGTIIMKKLLLISLLSVPAFASSNIANNFSYIGIGFQSAKYSSEALSPYFNDKYSNDEKKTLGGLYIDVNANLVDKVFFDGYADFATRISSDVDTWKAGLGYAFYSTPTLSVPASCGWINYHAERDSRSYSEGAGYCKVGVKTQIANHWLLDATYQHEFLDKSKDTLGIKNVFQFGRVFGLVAGFKYAERIESEITYQLGMQFSFH